MPASITTIKENGRGVFRSQGQPKRRGATDQITPLPILESPNRQDYGGRRQEGDGQVCHDYGQVCRHRGVDR